MNCFKPVLIVAVYFLLSFFLVACSVIRLVNTNRYNFIVYIVQKGDSLCRISRITGTSMKELAKINNIRFPYTIKIMQKLKVKNKKGLLIDERTFLNKSISRIKKRKNIISFCSATMKNNWIWPAIGKVVVSNPAVVGRNKGIDIVGIRGSPIYAAGTGKVIYIGNQLRGYGNLIIIKHKENFMTVYAHNDKILVNVGQNVKAGQKIATMGSTGTNFVFLHFQMRYREIAIDPQQYLPIKNKNFYH